MIDDKKDTKYILDSQIEDLIGISKMLGEQGFVIPHFIPGNVVIDVLYEVHFLLKDSKFKDMLILQGCTEDEFKFFFTEYFIEKIYSSYDYSYYEIQKNRLLTCEKLDYVVKDNLIETIKTYENQYYFPALCGLFSIVDRIISIKDNQNQTNWKKNFESRIQSLSKKSIEYIQAVNLLEFIESLIKRCDFSKDEPLSLNRHWIMHGRTNKKTTKVECLKVFALIDSLIDLLL